MKDIEKAKEFLKGRRYGEPVAEIMLAFAQQYHQEQLSKLPSEHGVRGKLSPIVLVLDLVELADNKSFHKEELNKQVVNAVSQARKSISALCNMFNEDYPKPELSKLPSDEEIEARFPVMDFQ